MNKLLHRLNPVLWPFDINDLPEGSVLVGGAVRDALLNRNNSIPDLDFVVPEEAINTSHYLAKKYGGTAVELDKERDIARYVIGDWKIDLASQVGKDLKEDLLRRDFTINAIAFQLLPSPFLLDPAGGLKDLLDKRLIAISEKNLIEDPLRILRGLRMISELNLELDKKTENMLRDNANLLKTVSPERIKFEIERLIHAPWADEVMPLLREIRLLHLWTLESFPEEFHYLSLKNVSSFTKNELKIALPLVRLTLLFSERGMIQLGFSKKIIRTCNLLRKWMLRYYKLGFKNLTENDQLRLHIDLENHLPALILLLPIADQKIWLRRWRDPLDPLFHPSCPINGNTLRELLEAPAGPWIGQLISYLCKERAFGRLRNNEEACDMARNWWKHNQPFCD